MRVDAVDIGGDGGAVAAGHRAQLQILLNRDARKRAPALRHMRDAEAHDVLGGAARDALAVEADLAGGAHHPGDGAQHRGLAGAVGTKQGADLARIQIEADLVEGLILAVIGVEPVHFEHHADTGRLFAGRPSVPPWVVPR